MTPGGVITDNLLKTAGDSEQGIAARVTVQFGT